MKFKLGKWWESLKTSTGTTFAGQPQTSNSSAGHQYLGLAQYQQLGNSFNGPLSGFTISTNNTGFQNLTLTGTIQSWATINYKLTNPCNEESTCFKYYDEYIINKTYIINFYVSDSEPLEGYAHTNCSSCNSPKIAYCKRVICSHDGFKNNYCRNCTKDGIIYDYL